MFHGLLYYVCFIEWNATWKAIFFSFWLLITVECITFFGGIIIESHFGDAIFTQPIVRALICTVVHKVYWTMTFQFSRRWVSFASIRFSLISFGLVWFGLVWLCDMIESSRSDGLQSNSTRDDRIYWIRKYWGKLLRYTDLMWSSLHALIAFHAHNECELTSFARSFSLSLSFSSICFY